MHKEQAPLDSKTIDCSPKFYSTSFSLQNSLKQLYILTTHQSQDHSKPFQEFDHELWLERFLILIPWRNSWSYEISFKRMKWVQSFDSFIQNKLFSWWCLLDNLKTHKFWQQILIQMNHLSNDRPFIVREVKILP